MLLKFLFRSYILTKCIFPVPAALAADSAVVKEIHLPANKIIEAFNPRRLVLMIGVQNFKNQNYRPLKYPEKDVRDVSTFFSTHNPQQNDMFISLLNDDATEEAVIKAFDELERKNTAEDDIVIVYLSTHGTLAYEKAGQIGRFAVFHDSKFDVVGESGIPISYIQNRLARLKSNKKAAIFALCHSGAGKSQLPSSMERELMTLKSEFFTQPLHEVSTATMMLSASSWGQPAREDETLQNDIYTHFLLEGLSKHDTNGDGAISLFEAHEFARSRTYDFTRGKQTPTAFINVSGTDPIILNGKIKHTSNPLLFADSERFRNLKVVVNGESKGTLWNPQTLPSGRVRLALMDPAVPDQPLMDHHVYLSKDNSYPVSALFSRAPTTGVEARISRLPVPGNIENFTEQAPLAPGIYLRMSDILGSRAMVGTGYSLYQHGETVEIDTETSNTQVSISHLRLDSGLSMYPSANQVFTLAASLQHLAIERQIDNFAFENRTQKMSLTYPAITADWRAQQIIYTAYSGFYADLLPVRTSGINLNNKHYALSPLTGGAYIGINF